MKELMASITTGIPAHQQKTVLAVVRTARFPGRDQQHQLQEDPAHVPYLLADHPRDKHTEGARQTGAEPVHHHTTLTDGQHTPVDGAALQMIAHSPYNSTEMNKEAQRIHLPCAGAPTSTETNYKIIRSPY